MDVSQALKEIQILGDKASSGGLFKTVNDAVLFRQAVEVLAKTINDQYNELIDLKKTNDGGRLQK